MFPYLIDWITCILSLKNMHMPQQHCCWDMCKICGDIILELEIMKNTYLQNFWRNAQVK